MGKSKFETSLETGHHALLRSFSGKWAGTCKTWFEKDILADESSIAAEVGVILEGRFVNYTYTSSLNGKAYEGIMTLGYDLANDKCQCSWVDSFHMGTGILLSEGTAITDGFQVLGSYGGPGIPEPWGWRTEFTLTPQDEFIVTAFNISPEGEEAKATEAIYKRTG